MMTQRSFEVVRSQLVRLSLVVLAAILLPGCGGGGEGGPGGEVVMEVVIDRPTVKTVEDTVSAVGTIAANERVEIQPEVPGLIQEVLFVEGERVEKDQLLFTMEKRIEMAAVEQAKAELELAESDYRRALTLTNTRAISQQEVDRLGSLVQVRTAALNAANERLEERDIEAPFEGVLGPRQISPGQFVDAGAPLVTLVDDSRVKVTFRIPERQLGLVREGQEARLQVAAWPDRVFTGKVDLINTVVDPATRTAEVRLMAPNPDGLLRPGMFARVALVVQERPEALVIPEGALVASLGNFSVYVVNDDVAHLRAVELGVRMEREVEIREGLTPDSRIIVSGIQKIVDGMKVTNAPPSQTEEAVSR